MFSGSRNKIGIPQFRFAERCGVRSSGYADGDLGQPPLLTPTVANRLRPHVDEEVMCMTTSKKDASRAASLLSSSKTSAKVKSVAGSDLAQAKRGKGSKKK
jgi:hypothetical protein